MNSAQTVFRLDEPGLNGTGADNLDAPDREATERSPALLSIEKLNAQAERRFHAVFLRDHSLTRPLVSFQANKSRAIYRWFKYKEAFSVGLVEHLLGRFKIGPGVLLDPFAGSGTALFAGSAFGLRAEGIELLPIGQKIIKTKQLIDRDLKQEDIETLVRWMEERPWRNVAASHPINELRITKGAYPQATLLAMAKYLDRASVEEARVQEVLSFALLCALESVSYTRKDGQYLRWDHRSDRRQGRKLFNKGTILPFDRAITDKLAEIVTDLKAAPVPEDLFRGTTPRPGQILLHSGSCLNIMPKLNTAAYDLIITSPPYCNRYDYTRTYALELALLGVDESGLARLRQDMLSCTVENRSKSLLAMHPGWRGAISAADNQPLLQAILSYLETQRECGLLNNNGIPRMVRGYCYEMACVIGECARVLKPGAPLLMVNDNVRYAGASISVDVILSEIAQHLGFEVENILVLPNGKGNSSQQMGAHGREALRKCVYVWRRR